MFKKITVQVVLSLIISISILGIASAGAKSADLDVQCELAKRYLNGNGVEQNPREAFRLYTIAAKKGSARAQNQLGIMYSEGDGVAQNCGEAIKWYRKAAKQGYSKASINLALRYHDGVCVQKDIQKSLQILTQCGNTGDVQCMQNASAMYKDDFGDMAMSFKWALKAAEGNDSRSQGFVCAMYARGEGVKQNINRAIYWCRRGASRGDENSIDILNSMGVSR